MVAGGGFLSYCNHQLIKIEEDKRFWQPYNLEKREINENKKFFLGEISLCLQSNTYLMLVFFSSILRACMQPSIKNLHPKHIHSEWKQEQNFPKDLKVKVLYTIIQAFVHHKRKGRIRKILLNAQFKMYMYMNCFCKNKN